MRVLLALLASVALGVLFLFADRLRRPLVWLMRALLVGLTALLIIAGLAIGAAGLANEAWWAAVIGGGFLLAALRLGWALRRHTRPQAGGAAHTPAHLPRTSEPGDPRWRRFEASLDWVGRKQARSAHRSIEGLLAERASPSLTHEQRALLIACEKRVPELLDTCLDRCRHATLAERESYMDETLDRLRQLGGEAERARREVRDADDRRLHVLHRYFDNVAESDERQKKLP